jgi:hypothetical protein
MSLPQWVQEVSYKGEKRQRPPPLSNKAGFMPSCCVGIRAQPYLARAYLFKSAPLVCTQSQLQPGPLDTQRKNTKCSVTPSAPVPVHPTLPWYASDLFHSLWGKCTSGTTTHTVKGTPQLADWVCKAKGAAGQTAKLETELLM